MDEGENWVALLFGGFSIALTVRLVWGVIRDEWREFYEPMGYRVE